MILSSHFLSMPDLRAKMAERTKQGLGFPTKIINAKSGETFRDRVKASLSIFMNRKGRSFMEVENLQTFVPENFFYLTNGGQTYNLGIIESAETFNIHVGDELSHAILGSVGLSSQELLENEDSKQSAVFFANQLYRIEGNFQVFLDRLYQAQQQNYQNSLFWEENMVNLVNYLFEYHQEIQKKIQKIPATQHSTKIELYKRLSRSIDFIHAFSDQPLDLQSLANAACLSKFHFLRLFKAVFGLSPYQYWQKIRIDHAKHLLQNSQIPIYEIAIRLGFENSNSFSRLFWQRTHTYPQHYRQAV